MLASFRVVLSLTFLSVTAITAFAQQERAQASAQMPAPTVTGAASDQRVRFNAPASVVQIRLEVYDPAGEKRFDNEVRGGNVLDWHLQDGQAGRLPAGTYLCVVTVKSLSGKITPKIGSVVVAADAARLQPVDDTQLTARQSQAVGPVEKNSALTVVQEDSPQSGTVIAHNGEEGQISRTTGALSFRLGDFLRGNDTEQMRLTAEGSLGIGTSAPASQARCQWHDPRRAGDYLP